MSRSSVKEGPHSSDLRVHRLSDAPATFFVTKSLYPKKAILDESVRDTIVLALAFSVEHKRIHLRAFVVMPDHWHALFALRNKWTLPRFTHDLMSFIGGKTSSLLQLHHTSWQDGYYDTRVKTAKQFSYVAAYIEQNPVAKGLVELPEEWTASSAYHPDLVTEPWPWVYD